LKEAIVYLNITIHGKRITTLKQRLPRERLTVQKAFLRFRTANRDPTNVMKLEAKTAVFIPGSKSDTNLYLD